MGRPDAGSGFYRRNPFTEYKYVWRFRRWKRFWCRLTEHQWVTIRCNVSKHLSLLHLHLRAGLDSVCARCGEEWFDAKPVIEGAFSERYIYPNGDPPSVLFDERFNKAMREHVFGPGA